MEKVQLKSSEVTGNGEHYFVYWENEEGSREIAGIAHYTPFSKLGEYKFKLNWLPSQLFYLKQVTCEGNRVEYRVYSLQPLGTQKLPSAKPTGGTGVSVKIPVDEIYITTRAFKDALVIDLKSANRENNYTSTTKQVA